MNRGHEKCLCGKPVGHGRHFYKYGPEYWCECGFHSSRRSDLDKHLQRQRNRESSSFGTNYITLYNRGFGR